MNAVDQIAQRREPEMHATPRRLGALSVAIAVGLTMLGLGQPAAAAERAYSPSAAAANPNPHGLRPVEYLTRGLVAAQVAGGIFLSWRFLGDEPDGLSWNVYRKDGDADFAKITTIAPQRRAARERLRHEPRRREGGRHPVELHRPRRRAHVRLRGRARRRRRRGRPAGHERAHAVGPPGRAGPGRTGVRCTTSR